MYRLVTNIKWFICIYFGSYVILLVFSKEFCSWCYDFQFRFTLVLKSTSIQKEEKPFQQHRRRCLLPTSAKIEFRLSGWSATKKRDISKNSISVPENDQNRSAKYLKQFLWRSDLILFSTKCNSTLYSQKKLNVFSREVIKRSKFWL
jgi:hypothetical protein